MHRIIMQHINERAGKKATVRECFRMDVEEIGVLELVQAIEKIRAKREPTGRSLKDRLQDPTA